MAVPIASLLNPSINEPILPIGPVPHPQIRRSKGPRPYERSKTRLSATTYNWMELQSDTGHKGFTIDQIAHACQADRPTPKKKTGRPSVLTQAQIEELVEFVCASSQNRRMSFAQLANIMDFGVKQQTIRSALMREGFHRRLAMRKPPISERKRQTRLAWAIEHKDWRMEQWYRILWTDETWITGGRHTRTWVTRRPGEEWDPTCIVERHQRKNGWMFWGCFHGHTQGPGFF